jgi:hypothetical protein
VRVGYKSCVVSSLSRRLRLFPERWLQADPTCLTRRSPPTSEASTYLLYAPQRRRRADGRGIVVTLVGPQRGQRLASRFFRIAQPREFKGPRSTASSPTAQCSLQSPVNSMRSTRPHAETVEPARFA